jgi:hypothetical protein
MQTRMQPGPLNDLCGVMTTKVGLHICGRVYSSLRGIPQANEEVWEAAPRVHMTRIRQNTGH